MTRSLRLKFLLLIILSAALIITYFVVQNVRFRVVDSSPRGKVFPTSSQELVLTFNKNINPKSIDKKSIKTKPTILFNAIAIGNKLHISLDRIPSSGDIEFSINNLESTSGKFISITRKFQVRYVPFDQLTPYEQQQQVVQTNGEELQYPIIKKLPVLASGYTVDYKLPDGNGKLILTIDVSGINDNKNLRGSGTESYLDQMHQKALADIKSLGYNLDDFVIIYNQN